MARNGAGTYVLPAGQPVVTGTTISSTTHNTLANDLANALTTSIATDGQSVVTANIPFSGYKLTGIGAATVNGDALRFEDKTALIADSATKAGVQAQTYTAFTTAGTSTAYTLTTVPAAASLVADQRYRIKLHTANGATPTLARDGLAAVAFKVYDATGAKVAPAAAALPTLFDAEYDGTDMVVLTQLPIAAVLLTGSQTIAGTKTFSSMPVIPFGQLTNSLGADVALTNTANYFDGPSIAQGTTGTWWVSGSVVVIDSNAGGGNIHFKLWDGATVISSGFVALGLSAGIGNQLEQIELSGFIANPAGNLRISVRNASNTANTSIKFNQSGNSKDSTISAFRLN